MPAPIVVKFAVGGEREVLEAFRTIERRAAQMEKTEVSQVQRAARVRRTSTDDVVRDNERKIKSIDKWLQREERAEQQRQKAFEKSIKKIEDAQAKSDAKEANRLEKIAKREQDAIKRNFDAKLRLAQQAEDKMVRMGEREHLRREKAIEREWAKERALVAKGNMGMFRGAGGIISSAGRSAVGTVSGIAGGLIGTSATMMISDAVYKNVGLGYRAAQLANAVTQGGAVQSGMTAPELEAKSRSLAKYGINSDQTMKAMGEVAAKAGGAKGLSAFMRDMGDLAMTATAAGVSFEDMGKNFAAAFNAGIQPGQEMQQLMRDLVEVGKSGSVEFKDLASELPKLLGAGLETELRGGALVRRQVGMAQIAVKQRVSPEESRTSVMDVIRDIGMKSDTIKRQGINIYGASGMQKDPVETVASLVEAAFTKGIVDKKGRIRKGSEGLFGGTEPIFTGTSKAVVTAAIAEFQKTGNRQSIVDMFNTAGGYSMTSGERNLQFSAVQGTTQAQLDQAMEDFRNKMAALSPKFAELVPRVGQAAEGLAKLTVWAASNPFSGLAAAFTGYLVKEGVGASLGAVFKDGLKANLAGITTVTLTAATVFMVGKEYIDTKSKEGDQKGKTTQGAYWEAENALRNVAGGTPTEEDKNRLSELYTKLKDARGRTQELADIGNSNDPAYAGLDIGEFFATSAETSAAGIAQGTELDSMLARIEKAILGPTEVQKTTADLLKEAVEKFDGVLTELGPGLGIANPASGPRVGVPAGLSKPR